MSNSDVVTGATFTRTRCATWTISITDVGNIAARTAFYFTIKRETSENDGQALVQIEETAGLEVINAEAATVAGNGSIVVTDAVAGDFTVTLAAVESCKLTEEDGLFYDVKETLAASVPAPVITGRFNIASIVTGAIT
jgi:hypothetical protein